MKGISFDWKYADLPVMRQRLVMKQLSPELQRLKAARSCAYDTPYASINLPCDASVRKKVVQLAKRYKNISALVVIGIGGSNLGTMAVHEAVNGRLHNEFDGIPVYWADTVDAVAMEDLLAVLPKSGVLLNVISKSGGTTETIANFELLQHAFPKAKVVVTTGKGSRLYAYAKKKKFPTLTIPENVGGRYSVFSPVGLFPLAVLGVDIEELLKGADDMVTQCLPPFTHNPAALSAAAHFIHNKQGRNIANTFLFAPDYEAVGKWYRQLMGESIGKEFNKTGTRKVNAGITPTVAIGSTDLHSMAQLYLGGPDDKLTTFVVIQDDEGPQLPNKQAFNNLVPNIQEKSYPQIMRAILGGVLVAYRKARRPYIHVMIPGRNEYALGQFLQFKMLEMMLLSYLLGVNPFDQPAVEQYKIETKRLLQ